VEHSGISSILIFILHVLGLGGISSILIFILHVLGGCTLLRGA
jgi:hypothetical protein